MPQEETIDRLKAFKSLDSIEQESIPKNKALSSLQQIEEEQKPPGLKFIAQETLKGAGQDLLEGVKETGRQVGGIAEGLMSAASGLASFVPSVAGGMIGLLTTQDPNKAEEISGAVAELGTYEPRTRLGQVYGNVFNSPFALLGKSMDWLAEKGAPGEPKTQSMIRLGAQTLLAITPLLKGRAKAYYESTAKPRIQNVLDRIGQGKDVSRYKIRETYKFIEKSQDLELENRISEKLKRDSRAKLTNEEIEYMANREVEGKPMYYKAKPGEMTKNIPDTETIPIPDKGKPPVLPEIPEGYKEISRNELLQRAKQGELKSTMKRQKALKVKDSMPKVERSYIEEIQNESAQITAKYPEKPPDIKEFQSGLNIRQAVHDLGVPTEALRRDFKSSVNMFRSPGRVLDVNEAGRRFYRSLAKNDTKKNSFLTREMNEFIKASEGISEGSVESSAVFKMRDNNLSIKRALSLPDEALTEMGFIPEEIKALRSNKASVNKLNTFFSKKFPYLLRLYGKKMLPEMVESKLWGASKKGMKDIRKALGRKKKGISDVEQQVFDLYNRKISNYITHIFDRQEMLDILRQRLRNLEKDRAKASPTEAQKMEVQGKRILTAIDNVENNSPLLYDILPQDVRFKFFETRKGMPGYQIDSVKAYKTYLHGLARKVFDEAGVKEAINYYGKLPEYIKPYAKWFIRDFMGYNERHFQTLASSIRSTQWMLKLGLNPRSAITNLTQQMNTIAEVGLKASVDGYKHAIRNTDNIRTKFIESGLPEEVEQVMMAERAAKYAPELESARKTIGYMFNKVEEGNRLHSFSTGYFRALKEGLPEELAIERGKDLVYKTQFRYGRVGMPRALRGGTGVLFQFWSYPIKQLEFLSHLWKNNKAGLIRWIALAEGSRQALDLAGLDLSPALGLGANYPAVFNMLEAITQGDKEGLRYWFKLSELGQGGILPYGFGPMVDFSKDFAKVLQGDMEFQDFSRRQLLPVTVQRVQQSTRAILEGVNEDGKFPIRNMKTGELQVYETLPQIISRVFLARPTVEKISSQEGYKAGLIKEGYTRLQQKISDLIVKGEIDKAMKIAIENKIPFSETSLEAAIERHYLTTEERALLNRAESMELYRQKVEK